METNNNNDKQRTTTKDNIVEQSAHREQTPNLPMPLNKEPTPFNTVVARKKPNQKKVNQTKSTFSNQWWFTCWRKFNIKWEKLKNEKDWRKRKKKNWKETRNVYKKTKNVGENIEDEKPDDNGNIWSDVDPSAISQDLYDLE